MGCMYPWAISSASAASSASWTTSGGDFPAPHPTLIHNRDATPAAYFASQPEQYAIIHFAAHADADRESPLDSAVTSHDAGGNYKLMHATFTTARYPFNADLVTVSACQPHDSPVDYFRSRDRH